MADFRSERMPSPEGEGKAKDALESGWDAIYATNKQVNKPIYAGDAVAQESWARLRDIPGLRHVRLLADVAAV